MKTEDDVDCWCDGLHLIICYDVSHLVQWHAYMRDAHWQTPTWCYELYRPAACSKTSVRIHWESFTSLMWQMKTNAQIKLSLSPPAPGFDHEWLTAHYGLYCKGFYSTSSLITLSDPITAFYNNLHEGINHSPVESVHGLCKFSWVIAIYYKHCKSVSYQLLFLYSQLHTHIPQCTRLHLHLMCDKWTRGNIS